MKELWTVGVGTENRRRRVRENLFGQTSLRVTHLNDFMCDVSLGQSRVVPVLTTGSFASGGSGRESRCGVATPDLVPYCGRVLAQISGTSRLQDVIRGTGTSPVV